MDLKILPLVKIVEDPDQPRKALDEATLVGLADSIRQHGLLNPITVLALEHVDAYRIITGERRWRASQLAGLTEIACIVRISADDTVDRTAEQLIENLQREDLTPLDKANAIQALKNALGATNKEAAQRLGLSERTVGYDFTFSVPKSVSLLYAMSGGNGSQKGSQRGSQKESQ